MIDTDDIYHQYLMIDTDFCRTSEFWVTTKQNEYINKADHVLLMGHICKVMVKDQLLN